MAKDSYKCRVLIPSNGRHKVATAPKLFPNAILVVRKSQAKQYASAFANEIHEVNDDMIGLAKIRNYCARIFCKPGTPVCMVDDDVNGCASLTGRLLRELTAGEMANVIESTAAAAVDAEAPIFGFSQSLDLTIFKPNDFIRLSYWAGSVVGITTPEQLWDESLKVRTDVDASLNALRKHRYVWIDTRFCFTFDSVLRSGSTIADDFLKIQRKWGKHIEITEMPDYTNMTVHVSRKQKLGKFYRSLELQSED